MERAIRIISIVFGLGAGIGLVILGLVEFIDDPRLDGSDTLQGILTLCVAATVLTVTVAALAKAGWQKGSTSTLLIASAYAVFNAFGLGSSEWDILYTLPVPLLVITTAVAFFAPHKTPA